MQAAKTSVGRVERVVICEMDSAAYAAVAQHQAWVAGSKAGRFLFDEIQMLRRYRRAGQPADCCDAHGLAAGGFRAELTRYRSEWPLVTKRTNSYRLCSFCINCPRIQAGCG